ncbi:hypothetical protein H696_01894 [Fonticula alba]|uniref:Uncharacterized protein n=1 Tax=Fonticula alba TaxID=691883 RepID=A0A058ZBZ4_FONAL|nr:hypothetical protein H696_01894 [Fonticula alba]KCV70947.1 hypothetical protein H696_01894 [Fonticula alba]|eukprot:XP_009494070.1 hypothetical protein H696_01894 [Fonticula alba]
MSDCGGLLSRFLAAPPGLRDPTADTLPPARLPASVLLAGPPASGRTTMLLNFTMHFLAERPDAVAVWLADAPGALLGLAAASVLHPTETPSPAAADRLRRLDIRYFPRPLDLMRYLALAAYGPGGTWPTGPFLLVLDAGLRRDECPTSSQCLSLALQALEPLQAGAGGGPLVGLLVCLEAAAPHPATGSRGGMFEAAFDACLDVGVPSVDTDDSQPPNEPPGGFSLSLTLGDAFACRTFDIAPDRIVPGPEQ